MILAIDQYGERVWLDEQHPRKDLLKKLRATKASKIYVDKKDGGTAFVGYVVNRRWFTFYRPWE